ncbi:glycosyltransferase [Halorussus litoreus]|uniref:glycosyltransferase n=1 Tax=Halorussus litoreus TaxID=1710536 RepID=UPI000E26460C|nr:glycosyltransferase [Halorussus litoreus]
MRVLIVPELYRPSDATANGTLNDAVVWVEEWLDIDPNLHVYWLLAPLDVANYDPEYVHADRERVTLIEAEPFMHGRDHQLAFTESGYSEAQLAALRDATYDRLGYVDVVVDQLRRGRADLSKWLLALDGHRVGQPWPIDIVTNVHDLQLPFKYAGTGWRDEFQRRTEVADAVLSDGMWFKAAVDASGMAEYGHEFMRESVVDAALDDAVRTGSPIDFSRFEAEYADEPRYLHVAGSIWEKKQVGVVMEIAELLHDRFDIRTVMTSMSKIPAEYADLPWVEAYPQATREEFETALRKGDICVSASEYETLARTWFEQAASGQVLIARNQPWIYDAIPEDYELAGPIEDLPDIAVRAVEHWDEATAAARRMLDHVEEIRDPGRSARNTYDDLADRVAEKVAAYDPDDNDAVVGKALTESDALENDRVALDDLNDATAALTDHGDPLLDGDCALSEVVFSLRRRGYADTGRPGTPIFEERE